MAKYLYICPKCGNHFTRDESEEPIICGSIFHKPSNLHDTIMIKTEYTEEEYKSWPQWFQTERIIPYEDKLYHKYLYNNPQFHLESFKASNEGFSNGRYFLERDFGIKTQPQKHIQPPTKPTVVCPYCHSKNTKKLSSGSRIFSGSLFGFGSKKLGKQWHCNDCGSDF